MTIHVLKQQIDIVEVVGHYTELTGHGNRLRAAKGRNPIRSDGSGDFDVYRDSQKYYDYGTGEGGDVVNFIKKVENLETADAMTFVSEKYLNGADLKSSYVPRVGQYKPVKKDNEALMAALSAKAKRYLSAPIIRNSRKRERYTWFEFEFESIKKVAAFDDVFVKLLEHSYIEISEDRITYIFDRFIGYDAYYDCPVIIIYDYAGNVVNIVKYRPKKDGQEFMKYLYLKAKDTPESDYLYPFQYEMEKMMLEQKVAYVAEGLKNSVNALMFGLPCVSTESASGDFRELARYLQSDRFKDVFYIGAFDGDEAGKKAYKKMRDLVPLNENLFEFDSGTDFAEYLKKEQIA